MIRATTATETAISRVAGTCSAHVSSASSVVARAISGVSGGWSTYPHCGGSIRKYSSSRWYPYAGLARVSASATAAIAPSTGAAGERGEGLHPRTLVAEMTLADSRDDARGASR